MPSLYKNAADVLPDELLRQVRRYHQGLLWVSGDAGYREDRDALIEQLRSEGVTVKEIARLCGVSVRRVHQIMRGRRERADGVQQD